MPTVRIANANLEWMNYWFTNDSDAIGWRPTDSHSGKPETPGPLRSLRT